MHGHLISLSVTLLSASALQASCCQANANQEACEQQMLCDYTPAPQPSLTEEDEANQALEGVQKRQPENQTEIPGAPDQTTPGHELEQTPQGMKEAPGSMAPSAPGSAAGGK